MEKISVHKGIVAPLQAHNVDTDQIIPKQFLKRIVRKGYEDALFYDWRFKADGKTPDPEFEMNAPRYQGATILLTGENFGCGSSREHAPWALNDYGFRVIIAASFADIFYNNLFNNGMLPIQLPVETIDGLFEEARATEGYALEIDLPGQKVVKPDGGTIAFEIDEFKKYRLLEGLDQIGLTLLHEERISAFEAGHGIAAGR